MAARCNHQASYLALNELSYYFMTPSIICTSSLHNDLMTFCSNTSGVNSTLKHMTHVGSTPYCMHAPRWVVAAPQDSHAHAELITMEYVGETIDPLFWPFLNKMSSGKKNSKSCTFESSEYVCFTRLMKEFEHDATLSDAHTPHVGVSHVERSVVCPPVAP
jgi:hypothetical protein